MHPPSYWQATTGRDPLPDAELPPTAEVVVVGGGVHGSFAALWLARAGARPLLIDRGGPAFGASGRNGGLLVTGTTEGYTDAVARHGREVARAHWGLSVEGLHLTQAVIAEEQIACDLRPSGNLGLALSEAGLAGQRANIALLAEDGFTQHPLSRREAEEIAGTPLGPEVLGGKINPNAATLHSTKLVYGLAAAAQRHGARLCWGAELRGLRAEGGRIQVETSRGAVSAGAVVLSANAWLGDLLPELAGLITPVRGQALATAPGPFVLRPGFGVSMTPTGEYGQQTADGSVVFGGFRAAAPGYDVGERATTGSAEVQAALDAGLARLFPALARLPVAHRWGGTMGFSKDYMMIVDQAEGLPGVWYAGGFSGHGMPFAAPLGRLLAEAALSGRAPEPLAPFRRGRATLA